MAKLFSGYGKPKFKPEDAFPAFLLVMLILMLTQTVEWEYGARLVPLFVGAIVVPALAISLFNQVFRRIPQDEEKLHMDIAADHGELSKKEVIRRALIYLGWLVGLMISIGMIGFIPSSILFVIAYMRGERREPWWLAITMGLGMGLFLYLVFNEVLNVIWPESYLGQWIPALGALPSM